MDFTREPIIETVITSKDGYKIVVRSSKTIGQEEYFVDAVEVVSFGGASFFRSLERPKAFLVPVSDYEVLEVREARVVLKNVGLDRSIKIAGGREGQLKTSKEEPRRENIRPEETRRDERKEERKDEDKEGHPPQEGGRGRSNRRPRRGRRRGEPEEVQASTAEPKELGSSTSEHGFHEEKVDIQAPRLKGEEAILEGEKISNSILSGLLTPPPTLISETLHRYRDNALFKSAFYTEEELGSSEIAPAQTSEVGLFEATQEEDQSFWEAEKKEAPANGALPNE